MCFEALGYVNCTGGANQLPCLGAKLESDLLSHKKEGAMF